MAAAPAGVHAAVARGDIDAVTRFHADDADLEARDGEGRTPMVLAAQRCDVAMLDHLYRLGARPGSPDGNGVHPWYAAATSRDPPLRQQLVALELMAGWSGVDLDCEEDDFGTALEELCRRVPPAADRERVGAVVRLLILKGCMVYRGGIPSGPVRSELLRRIDEWLATQRALDTFLAGCRFGHQAGGYLMPSTVRMLRNLPRVRCRIGRYVGTLRRVETLRLVHAGYAIRDAITEEETQAVSLARVPCYVM